MKVFITGASEGIGRACTELLLQKGHRVYGVARNEDRLKEIKKLNENFEFLTLDCTLPDSLKIIENTIKEENFDCVINNAGFGWKGAFSQMDLALAQNMIALNVNALVAISHFYAQSRTSGGIIINISSIVGEVPFPFSAIYGATKAFVSSFSVSLYEEFKERGLYVCAIEPGATDTQFFKRAQFSKVPKMIQSTPGEVAEVIFNAISHKKKPKVVVGLLNKLVVCVSRFIPLKILLKCIALNNSQGK